MHIRSFLTCIVVLLTTVLPAPVNGQTTGETFYANDLKLTITAADSAMVIGTTAADRLVIPGKVAFNGTEYTIAAIAPDAFKSSGIVEADLTSAAGLRRIGARAFAECQKLENVKLPPLEHSHITEIGPLAFHHATALCSINLEDTHIEVLEALFTKDATDEVYFDELEELRLPESLKKIKSFAMQFLGIKEISIPEGVTAIGEGILEGNIYLEEVCWRGAQVTSLPQNTFLGDDALRKVSILTVKPIDANGLSDLHFYMCHKELLTVYVTQESYDSLLSGGYDNETTVYSTLAVDTEWTTGIEDVRAGHSQANTDGPVFNLRGQRVVLTRQGEVYIRDGKKFVAR